MKESLSLRSNRDVNINEREKTLFKTKIKNPKMDGGNSTKWRSFNSKTSFIFSRSCLSFLFSQFNVHFRFCSRHFLVLVACLLLQSWLSIYSCFRLSMFFSRSLLLLYRDTRTPLDHALAVGLYVIVVHPLKNVNNKRKTARRKRKKDSAAKHELN